MFYYPPTIIYQTKYLILVSEDPDFLIKKQSFKINLKIISFIFSFDKKRFNADQNQPSL